MIETRDKRSSALHVGSPWRAMWPLADGAALNVGDRQHTAFMYRGIASTIVAETGPPTEVFTGPARGQNWKAEKRGEVFSSPSRGQTFAAEDR